MQHLKFSTFSSDWQRLLLMKTDKFSKANQFFTQDFRLSIAHVLMENITSVRFCGYFGLQKYVWEFLCLIDRVSCTQGPSCLENLDFLDPLNDSDGGERQG